MQKKFKYSIIIAFICIMSLFFFYLVNSFKSSLNTNTPCAFCNRQIINCQKFYEDDLVIALCTHKPIVPSHFLIIPKRHVEKLEMLSSEEVASIHRVIGKVNEASQKVFHTSPYFIHQKNGPEVGQSVPHVHFHFIAKSKGDDSHLKFFFKTILAHLKKPLSSEKLQDVTEQMKSAMHSSDSTYSTSP